MSKSVVVIMLVSMLGTYWLGTSKAANQEIIRIVNKSSSEAGTLAISNTASAEPAKDILNLKPEAKNIVYVKGQVGAETDGVAAEISRLSAKGEGPTFLLIDSPGGSVLDGALILSAMEASKVPVYTVCLSLCASMAAVIHQYGSKRYAIDRSILMFHPASGGVQGTLEQQAARLNTITRYVYKMNAYIAKKANLTLEKYNALTVSELWIDAEDAMKQGFVDGIVSLTLPEESKEAIVILTPEEKAKETIKDKFNFNWN